MLARQIEEVTLRDRRGQHLSRLAQCMNYFEGRGGQLAWCESEMRDFVVSRSSNNPHLRATVGIEKMDANDLNSDTVRGSLAVNP